MNQKSSSPTPNTYDLSPMTHNLRCYIHTYIHTYIHKLTLSLLFIFIFASLISISGGFTSPALAQFFESDCTDGIDNDFDGLPDCADPDCFGHPFCGGFGGCAPFEFDCTNGIDDDCDGPPDCFDSDCFGVFPCFESNCGDGIDDDGDGLVDCADSDCSGVPACVESICNDGVDNDGDGLVDCADPDCKFGGTTTRTRFVPRAIITNGTIQLGVNAAGHLNVPGGSPSQSGRTTVGLRFLPTNADAISPGCLCEGWGVADNLSCTSAAGWANETEGGAFGMTLESFSADATTATSVVNIGGRLRVTHFYHPSSSPNLYQADVTIENISGAPVELLYRRVLDWDVEPTPFSEFVTIDTFVTINTGTASNLVFTSNDGFASANPLSGPSDLGLTGTFTDAGPRDHGALFDFNFGTLDSGATRTFTIFYGAAATEAEANAALTAVGAQAFSFGQPNTPGGPTLGTPNTFIFAYRGDREDCSNGIDDDGDGLVDCADPECCDDPICFGIPPCTVLTETIQSQQAVMNGAAFSGDFTSTLNFTNLEFVTINTGPFAGKGFSKGACETTLEGIPYTGEWRGAVFLKPQERRIHLKGAISGQITATVEGFLSESVTDSGVYDRYQATWKIGNLGGTAVSAIIDLNGNISYQSSSEFPGTALRFLQDNIIPPPLVQSEPVSVNTVLTHLRVVSEDNPYFGEGFSIISYNSESGSGQGWTYDRLVSPGRVEMKGLFSSPLFGIASATLDESTLPRTLSLSIERIDLALPPMADLEVRTWGPERVSPGQTVDYLVEYRNEGIRNADNVVVMALLPHEVEYVSSTGEGVYGPDFHSVFWGFVTLPAKSLSYLSVRVRFKWGLPNGYSTKSWAFIGTIDGTELDRFRLPEATPFTEGWFERFFRFKEIKTTSGVSVQAPDPPPRRERVERGSVAFQNVEAVIDYIKPFSPEISNQLTRLLTEGKIFVKPNFDKLGQWSHLGRSMTLKPKVDDSVDITNVSIRGKIHILDGLAGTLVHETQHALDGYSFQGLRDETTAYDRETQFYLWRIQQELNRETVDRVNETNVTSLLGRADAGWGAFLEKEVPRLNLGDRLSGQFSQLKEIGRMSQTTINNVWKLLNHGITSRDFDPVRRVVNTMVNPINEEINTLRGVDVQSRNTTQSRSRITPARDPNIKLFLNDKGEYVPAGGAVVAGQTLNYRVEFENEGEGIAFGVYFTDTLDEDLDDSTLTIGPVIQIIDGVVGPEIGPPGTYNPATRTITWFVSGEGEIGPNVGGFADFSVNVRSDTLRGTEIINYGTVYFPSVPEETRTNAIVSIIPIEICDNGIDDDGDELIDCNDPDCSGSACVEVCDDGIDNDGDSWVDCADTDCPPCLEICDDGLDNDRDGLVDCDDPDCAGIPPCVIPGDLDGDGDVDRNDLNIILAARNTPASGPGDPRDLDGDGMITVLDARKLTLLCTRPGCATQ